MIRQAYHKGIADAFTRFHVEDIKHAQFNAGTTPPISPAATQPQMPPSMPTAAPGPSALPTAPTAPNARPTL
jgi:hypothetical protein